MDLSPILNPLNDAQRAAVTAPPGPVLVLAGAGSGKTRVLTHRIAWVDPGRGRLPARDPRRHLHQQGGGRDARRASSSCSASPAARLWIGTFHGIAHRLLRMHWREASLAQGFQILDSEDQQRLIKKLLKAAELDETRWVPREVQWFINSQQGRGPPAAAPEGRQRPDPRRR